MINIDWVSNYIGDYDYYWRILVINYTIKKNKTIAEHVLVLH